MDNLTRNAVAPAPLCAEAFAPFGQVLQAPADGARAWFDDGLTNDRPSARASLSLIRRTQAATLPLTAPRMERHRHSSQSFTPMSRGDWLIGVAPDRKGAPDIDGFRAFVAAPGQGVTIAAGVWHLPLTVLTAPADFAIFMWLDGGPDDEDWVDLPVPVTIRAA
jgi:ureidoglycolate lyase